MRGETIRQDKMLHGVNPLVELLGQISGSNAGSKSIIEFVGSNLMAEFTREIASRNSWFKFLGRIAGSNCWGKLLGYVTPDVTDVTRDVTPNARKQTRPICGPQRANLGQRMATPTDKPRKA